MMDEIGKLHPNNVAGILKFANDRDILLINGSPTEQDALSYKHIYKLEKDGDSSSDPEVESRSSIRQDHSRAFSPIITEALSRVIAELRHP